MCCDGMDDLANDLIIGYSKVSNTMADTIHHRLEHAKLSSFIKLKVYK